MKKKFALLLSVLSVVMMLSACGATDPTTVDYNGVTYDQLYQESVSLGTALAGASVEQVEQEIAYLQTNATEESALYVDLCEKWLVAMEESGNFVDLAENGFTVTKSGKTLTTDLVLVFENRNVVFELVYSYYNMELTGVSINPEYSLGEKMLKAGMNTVISVTIVFAVLIVISLLIGCFGLLSKVDTKKKNEATSMNANVNKGVAGQVGKQPASEEEIVAAIAAAIAAEDSEIVAVISAAIAEYEGTSTDNFVVRSIRRR